MSVLQIQARKRSNSETDELSVALKALAEVGIEAYATPEGRSRRYVSIVVEGRKAWVAVCVLKGAGFRLKPAAEPATDYEIAVRSRATQPASIIVADE